MALTAIGHEGQVQVPGEIRKAARLRVGRIVQLVVDLTSPQARVRLRPKGKLTVPTQVREAAHLAEGTLVQIETTAAGSITVTPIRWQPQEEPRQDEKSPDQAWFWTAEWLEGEAEASTQIRVGKVRSFVNDQDFLDSLNVRER